MGKKTEKLYTESKWKGINQYRCTECVFDTLDHKTILEHIELHKPKTKPKSTIIPVYDRFGNPVKEG